MESFVREWKKGRKKLIFHLRSEARVSEFSGGFWVVFRRYFAVFLTLFDVLSVFECFGCCSLFMSGFWVVFECFRAFIERPVFGYTAEQTCV